MNFAKFTQRTALTIAKKVSETSVVEKLHSRGALILRKSLSQCLLSEKYVILKTVPLFLMAEKLLYNYDNYAKPSVLTT
ncbi:hypothetical protein BAU14_09800 [Enterococcus sp. CU9D]|nr:hypothetical protein BAU14_09800 [Enterococcus sp. CU9D]